MIYLNVHADTKLQPASVVVRFINIPSGVCDFTSICPFIDTSGPHLIEPYPHLIMGQQFWRHCQL